VATSYGRHLLANFLSLARVPGRTGLTLSS
jgi:hypothetical protein